MQATTDQTAAEGRSTESSSAVNITNFEHGRRREIHIAQTPQRNEGPPEPLQCKHCLGKYGLRLVGILLRDSVAW